MAYNAMPYPYNDMLVIEQDVSDGYETTDYFTYLTIGFVYVFFLSLLVDRYLKYDQVEKVCDISTVQTNEQYKTRMASCKKANDEHNKKKFMYMVVLGVVSILGGSYMTQRDPKYAIGGCGVTLGGMFSVIYYTIYNWSTINKDVRIILIGLAFALLFYGSTRIYE